MSSALNTTGKIQTLIAGYIRTEIKIDQIPIDIRNLCTTYYLTKDRFAECGSMIEILSSIETTDNKDIISDWVHPEYPGSTTGRCRATGEIFIDTQTFPNMIAKWTIKIDADCCSIGIDTEERVPKEKFSIIAQTDFENGKIENTYCYQWSGKYGDIHCWKDRNYDCLTDFQRNHYDDLGRNYFERGDIVKMELNAVKKQLIFEGGRWERRPDPMRMAMGLDDSDDDIISISVEESDSSESGIMVQKNTKSSEDKINRIILNDVEMEQKYFLAVDVFYDKTKSIEENGTVQILDFEILQKY